MLPAPKRDRTSLADVLPSCLSAIAGESNRLSLPAVTRAIVVLVDGLGAEALKARAGHARTLAGALSKASTMDSGFPTTTASALATLTTGVAPGQHGLVGYSVLDAANDRVVNQLSGWDAQLDPRQWQAVPTIFERAVGRGFGAAVIAPGRYRGSGFSEAVLRGADFIDGSSIADRFEKAVDWLRAPGPNGIAYLYVPELDQTGHAAGWESPAWTTWLELLDGEVRSLVAALGPKHGVLVTADHGVVDVPHHAHILIDELPGLLDGVRFVAGEPRCLQLHFEPDASPERRAELVQAWRDSEESRSWVATRDEAIEAGWFGDVLPEIAPRIGDLVVAARKNIAYYDGRAKNQSGRKMVGQHGSWSPAEVQVPLLRFGAFAR